VYLPGILALASVTRASLLSALALQCLAELASRLVLRIVRILGTPGLRPGVSHADLLLASGYANSFPHPAWFRTGGLVRDGKIVI
jgi:hypothetical protein